MDPEGDQPPVACGRSLTEEEAEKLRADITLVSSFQREKLEREAKRNWDLFYKRNSTHFFKDRHWIAREFPELVRSLSVVKEGRPVLLEAGCGVGNTVFPLLEENRELFVYACDFSPRAVEFLRAHSSYTAASCHAFTCDLTTEPLTSTIAGCSVDIASLFFVLSAITPTKMVQVLRNIFEVLKPGGLLLFRDYGLYDHAMLRFSPGHKIEENFYVRQDGTRAYYFSEDKLAELVAEAGFEVVVNRYIEKETVNRKEDICVPRMFVQGKFIKPKLTKSSKHSPA